MRAWPGSTVRDALTLGVHSYLPYVARSMDGGALSHRWRRFASEPPSTAKRGAQRGLAGAEPLRAWMGGG